jgi:hypothetical protein
MGVVGFHQSGKDIAKWAVQVEDRPGELFWHEFVTDAAAGRERVSLGECVRVPAVVVLERRRNKGERKLAVVQQRSQRQEQRAAVHPAREPENDGIALADQPVAVDRLGHVVLYQASGHIQ